MQHYIFTFSQVIKFKKKVLVGLGVSVFLGFWVLCFLRFMFFAVLCFFWVLGFGFWFFWVVGFGFFGLLGCWVVGF
jgi:hypothetical protein